MTALTINFDELRCKGASSNPYAPLAMCIWDDGDVSIVCPGYGKRRPISKKRARIVQRKIAR